MILLVLFIVSSCTACPECGKEKDEFGYPDPDVYEVPDLDVDSDKGCPPYTGECAFIETTICRDDDVYQCIQRLQDGCIVDYNYQWVESCPSGCKVDVSPSATHPGEVHCIPLSEDPCPDFSLINFPLSRSNFPHTFCRECDTSTDDDLYCVDNLWKHSNEKLCVDKPSYDCCGYPCEMNNLAPRYKEDFPNMRYESQAVTRCDILLNPKDPVGWDLSASYYGVPAHSYRLSHGKIAFFAQNRQVLDMDYYGDKRYFEYDVKTQKYRVIAGSVRRGVEYHNGSFVGIVRNLLKNQPEEAGYPVLFDGSGKKRQVLQWTKYYLRSTPILTDKWILMDVVTGNSAREERTIYGRIDQPTLYSIGEPLYDTSIVGNTLIYTDEDGKMGYACHFSDTTDVMDTCMFFNRGGEEFYGAELDRENSQLIYYSDLLSPNKIIRVDLSTIPFSYKEFIIDSPDNIERTDVLKVRGNLALIRQRWEDVDADGVVVSGGSRACYYRLDSEEVFCPEPIPWGDFSVYAMYDGDFEGHTLVWMKGDTVKVRDMECYCDWHSELCPFDDYTPNTEHPKNKGFKDERL